jgi:transcriptional regulator with XRE-family HTH domain
METHAAQQIPPIEKMGPRIRRLRKRLGLTQEELGAKVGVKELAVGDWEREKYAPRGDNLVALADELGVPPHYLLYGEAGVYREAIEQIADIVDRALTSPPADAHGVASAKASRAGKGKPRPERAKVGE